jgi:putative ABC transport system permease protein
MRDFVPDLTAAFRALRTRPTLTIAAVLTLALSIGATTSIFTVVNGVVLRPLPFPNESRLVTICEQYPGSTPDWCSISPPNVSDIAERSRAIDAIGFGRSWGYHLATPTGDVSIDAGLATPGMFRALGVDVVLGRMIRESDLLGRPSSVALLSYEMWRDRFGSDSTIVGRTLSLDKDLVTVVGVLPQGFQAPRLPKVELWRPVHINPRDEQHREWRGFVAYARLRPGVSLEVARRDLAGVAEQLRIEHFSATKHWNLVATSLRDLVTGSVRPVLMLFLGAVGLVLLIGCANVTNLLLARATTRGRELALRAALGASRGRIVSALLTESVVLALVGGILGIALAFGGVAAFKSLAPPGIPRIDDVRVDTRVLVFTLALSLATAVIFGLVPAIRGARVDLAQALREGGRSGTAHRGRLGASLVVIELALAIVVVAGAGLLGRSFVALAAWDPGFDRQQALVFSLSVPTSRYDSAAKIAALWDHLEGELRSIPGVTEVGTASGGPLFGGDGAWQMQLSGYAPDQRMPVSWYDVSPTFFRAMGVPVVRGRPLERTDAIGGPPVTLVNEALVRRYWPNRDPLGQRIGFPVGKEVEEYQVVGVVRDIPPLTPGAQVEPQMYWSNRQKPRPFTYVLVRSAVPASTVAPVIRARVKALDRDLEVRTIRTMQDIVANQMKAPRFNFILLASFGLAALALAAIGTYALLSYLVAQRTREIGIRMALGAEPWNVLRGVVSRALVLAGAGAAIGLVATLALGRVVSTLVVGVSPRDPLTLAATVLTLLIVAVAACVWPAWRASRVNPLLVLGAE